MWTCGSPENRVGLHINSSGSVATGGGMGGMCPQPQSGRVMRIAEIRGEKNAGRVEKYRVVLAKQITVKYVF